MGFDVVLEDVEICKASCDNKLIKVGIESLHLVMLVQLLLVDEVVADHLLEVTKTKIL